MKRALFAFLLPLALMAGDENMATLTDIKDALYILLQKHEKNEIDKKEMQQELKRLASKLNLIDSTSYDVMLIKNKLRQLNIEVPKETDGIKTEYYDRILDFNAKNSKTLGR